MYPKLIRQTDEIEVPGTNKRSNIPDITGTIADVFRANSITFADPNLVIAATAHIKIVNVAITAETM